VQYAFDNNPVTRWRSWWWLKPNAWILSDLGALREADQVRLEMSAGQWGVKMRLEGLDERGVWRALGEEPKIVEMAPPLGLRRLAMEGLKAGGITHLLVPDEEFQAGDYAEKAELWGIREVGRVDNMRLYRLE